MTKKKSTVKKTSTEKTSVVPSGYLAKLKTARRHYLDRRPHRSFQRTRRRDYVRSLKLPGYWAFTLQVQRTFWQHRRLFLWLTVVYAVLTAIMVGSASQDTYTTLANTLRDTGSQVFQGNMGDLGKAGLLFVTAATGGLSQQLTEVQQVYAALLVLMTWLTTVWLLRNVLAGRKVKVRDGLYNASSPLLSTVIVALVMVVQLLPLGIAIIGYSAASTTGLLNGGVEAMLFWIVAGLLTLMSLYWITSTFIALVVVTLPGMYPFQAIKTAGDLVIGRRFRILKRILWMALMIAIAWMLIMIPVIMFDAWLKGLWAAITWLPIVPYVLLALTSVSVIWSASYIYLLYRKVVADDAQPA